MWIVVISANFKGNGKSPVLRESFIRLHRACGNIVSSFKILKRMSPLDIFVSSNGEVTSSKSLRVTGRNEKALIVMYLPLIFFILVWLY